MRVRKLRKQGDEKKETERERKIEGTARREDYLAAWGVTNHDYDQDREKDTQDRQDSQKGNEQCLRNKACFLRKSRKGEKEEEEKFGECLLRVYVWR